MKKPSFLKRFFILFSSAVLLSANSFAEEYIPPYDQGSLLPTIEFFQKLADGYEFTEEELDEWATPPGRSEDWFYFYGEQKEIFREEQRKVVSFSLELAVDINGNQMTDDDEAKKLKWDQLVFSFMTLDDKEYRVSYPLKNPNKGKNRTVYTVQELLADSGVPDASRVGLVQAWTYFYYIRTTNSDYPEYRFYDYTPGWNEIDGDRYYITPNGTILTSSTTIDGIRYKFNKSGICQGKYTGYTNSGKGRRFWKNGELVKNKWIRVKGERKYYAGANGYFVTGKRKIQGKDYLFDKNGALLGEAPAVIEYNAPDPDRLDEIDCVRVDFREAVSSGCSLALATCIGLTEQTKGRRVYAFLADEVICGGEVPRIFTVTVTEGDYAVEDEPGYTSAQLHFKENVRYLLPLRKADSLLPEDRFFSNGDALIELRDDLSIASASVQGRKITGLTDMNAVREFISSEKISCGQEIDQDFVRSDDLSEIVKGSDFILEVEIEGIVHDRAEDWTMYNCRLTDTVKAVKNDVRTVYAALPKDSVTLNGKYLLLLNRTRDKSFIYTLSSANGSLYPADAPEAAEVRKLIAPARKKEQNN